MSAQVGPPEQAPLSPWERQRFWEIVSHLDPPAVGRVDPAVPTVRPWVVFAVVAICVTAWIATGWWPVVLPVPVAVAVDVAIARRERRIAATRAMR